MRVARLAVTTRRMARSLSASGNLQQREKLVSMNFRVLGSKTYSVLVLEDGRRQKEVEQPRI